MLPPVVRGWRFATRSESRPNRFGFQDFVNPHVYRVDFFGEAGIETYYLRPRRLKMYIGGGVLLLILIILLIIFLL
jgi:hypothetical protein